MRHNWGRRTWWSNVAKFITGASTQTCVRCGASLRTIRRLKLLPGRRRPRGSVERWYRFPDATSFVQVRDMPRCELRLRG